MLYPVRFFLLIDRVRGRVIDPVRDPPDVIPFIVDDAGEYQDADAGRDTGEHDEHAGRVHVFEMGQ